MNDLDKKLVGPGPVLLFLVLVGVLFATTILLLDQLQKKEILRNNSPWMQDRMRLRTRDIIEQEKMMAKNKTRGKRRRPTRCIQGCFKFKTFELDTSGEYDRWTCGECGATWVVYQYGRKIK